MWGVTGGFIYLYSTTVLMEIARKNSVKYRINLNRNLNNRFMSDCLNIEW